jgi:hypothetical protein
MRRLVVAMWVLDDLKISPLMPPTVMRFISTRTLALQKVKNAVRHFFIVEGGSDSQLEHFQLSCICATTITGRLAMLLSVYSRAISLLRRTLCPVLLLFLKLTALR